MSFSSSIWKPNYLAVLVLVTAPIFLLGLLDAGRDWLAGLLQDNNLTPTLG
jgi:hypothetical protein